MRCPSCDRENPDNAKFCSECAASLETDVDCSSCGTSNAPGSKFCNECARPLTDAAPATRTPTPEPSPVLPPSFAGGRYEVKSFLGEGGRKKVYLAHDTRLDRDVAVAMIKTEGLDADGLERVHREAQSMARLGDHPNIVTVFDIGEENSADGRSQPYIVSQYMAGGELGDLLDKAEGRRLDLAEALLRPGGALLVKVFQGAEFPPLRAIFRERFDKVTVEKPKSSRSESVEVYLLGTGKRTLNSKPRCPPVS